MLQRYRKALDTSVKIATVHNVTPISGTTVILANVGVQMNRPCSSARGLGKPRTVRDRALTGYPRHRENRENGPKKSLSGKTQGIWKFCQNTGKTQGIWFAQVVNVLILKVKLFTFHAPPPPQPHQYG